MWAWETWQRWSKEQMKQSIDNVFISCIYQASIRSYFKFNSLFIVIF
jgi:hypothetical protein